MSLLTSLPSIYITYESYVNKVRHLFTHDLLTITRTNFESILQNQIIDTGSIVLTKRTESRAAMASMSAQETTPGQALSTELFIVSTTSYPLTEFKLGKANFSPSFPSSKIDPSQPY